MGILYRKIQMNFKKIIHRKNNEQLIDINLNFMSNIDFISVHITIHSSL